MYSARHSTLPNARPMRTTYEYTLTNDEFRRIFQRNQSLLTSSIPSYPAIQLLLFVSGAALIFVAVLLSNLPGKVGSYVANGMLVACVLLVLLIYLQRRGIMQRIGDRSHFTGMPHTLTVEDDGLAISSGNDRLKYLWPSFVRAEEYEGSVSLFLDNLFFYPVAAAAFADRAEREAFLAHVRARIPSEATTAVQVAIPATTPIADVESAPAKARHHTVAGEFVISARLPVAISILRQNLNNAFRLAFFARVDEDKMPVSWWQVVCFSLLSMAAPVVWALVAVAGEGMWNWYSLPGAAFHVPVLLLAAILLGYAVSRIEKMQALFQAFLMIAFAVDLVYYTLFFAFYRLPPGIDASAGYPVIYYGCALWMALASAVAAMRLTKATVHTRLVPLLISGLFIALPLSSVFRDRGLWERDVMREESATPVARNDITDEDNFYRQPVLLEQELAAVRPQRKGVTDVFFIGMAGYGPQDVFRREVDSVAKLFRERFDAEGHTIRLINNPKLAASAPIASVTSLRASLKRVAEVMDKDEDVLVLFLTSHGSETHRFALELWPLQFKELDPVKLRALLDESGIRYRVVVVSACYSGGFINALKGDDTLVITAAAPDRNSFGCGNENDWTYFGRAYFDEALRKTWSFTEAFELAKPVIAEREQKEQFKPSNPQMALGKNIQATLDRLQAQLADPAMREAAAAGGNGKQAQDVAARYAALRFDREFIAKQVRICKAAAQSSGPEVVIAANPDAYGGLNANSQHWPRLIGAWQRYIDEVCDRTSDPVLVQTMYAQFLREASSTRELESTLRFADTPAGTGWLSAEKRVDLRMGSELARIQTANQTRLYKIFLDEQQRIYQAFQEEAKRKKQSPGNP